MNAAPQRIDVHHHIVPPFYRQLLAEAGMEKAGGRAVPDWTPDSSLEAMDLLGTDTAIVSVSTPGTGFVRDPRQARHLASRLNDFAADLSRHRPRFGYFATLPMPDVAASAAEARRTLAGGADGVVLLANNNGSYLGSDGQDELWEVLDERGAVVFVHPAELPGDSVDGIPPFAADFLLDTTRAAYLLVRNRIVGRYPRIRFVLGHAGGFVPYASHRMALTIAGESRRSPLDVLEDFRGFYFDTALSSSPATLPTLLAFARPGHVLFGSDHPYAPPAAGQYFATGLDTTLDAATLRAVNRTNAQALFPRIAGPGVGAPARPQAVTARYRLRRQVARLVFSLVQPRE